MSIQTILDSYKNILGDLDTATSKVYASAPELPCKNKCFDCCKQLFPITFVEAYYLSKGIHETMPAAQLEERVRTARAIQEKITQGEPLQFEKRNVDRVTALNTHAEFARFLYSVESDCPALDPKNPAGACTVYEFRNHDCRTMGASVDMSSREVLGCHRFSSLGRSIPKLMNFNYRYQEKMSLDAELIAAVTDGKFTQNIYYMTTLCMPFLKDFTKENWGEFFGAKLADTINPESYQVVIDA